MNDTKWEELRVAMYELEQSPKWRTCDVETGLVSDWDGEWFSHFRADGYKTIRWVELLIESDQQHKEVLSELARIHVPGFEKGGNFFVVGYAESSQMIDYFSTSAQA